MVAVLAMASFSLPAMAQNMIVLGPTSGLQSQTCDLINAGSGRIQVYCFKASSGLASFLSATGTYSLGTMNNTFGPTNASGVLPADGTVDQSFQYGPDSSGNQTVGTMTWGTLDYQGDLSGVYVPTIVIGTAAFTATFQVGKSAQAALTVSGGSRQEAC